MRQFNVKDLGSPFETTALLIDDVVQNFFQDNDYTYRQGLYQEADITRNAEKNCENGMERMMQILRGYRGKNENGQSSTNDDNKNTYRINDIDPVR